MWNVRSSGWRPAGNCSAFTTIGLSNSFEVPAPDAENFITAWEKTRDYLESQPGYIETALHRAVTPRAEFLFVNIARWRTAQDFMTAIQSPGFAQAAAGLAGYQAHPALYGVVRT